MLKLDFLRNFVSQLSLFLLWHVNEWQRTYTDNHHIRRQKWRWKKSREEKSSREESSKKSTFTTASFWRKKASVITFHYIKQCNLSRREKNCTCNIPWTSFMLHSINDNKRTKCHSFRFEQRCFLQVHINASLYRKLFVVKSRQTLK